MLRIIIYQYYNQNALINKYSMLLGFISLVISIKITLMQLPSYFLHAGQRQIRQKLIQQAIPQNQEYQSIRLKTISYSQNHDQEQLRQQSQRNAGELVRRAKSLQKELGFFKKITKKLNIFGSAKPLKRCRVKACLESHYAHYCKVCKNSDSNHFSRNCKNDNRFYENRNIQMKHQQPNFHSRNNQIFPDHNQQRNPNQEVTNIFQNLDFFSLGFDQRNGNYSNNNFQPKIRCLVKGCSQSHRRHYCRTCKNENSDHFGRECPYGQRDSIENYSRNGKSSKFYEKGYNSCIISSGIDDDEQFRNSQQSNLRPCKLFAKIDPNKDSVY